MQSYLKILLEDIKAAHKGFQAEQPTTDSLEQQFREIDKFTSGDAEQQLSYHCGLNPDVFPPANRLSDNEKREICKELEEMYGSWNAQVDIPEEVPLSMKYDLMVNLLNQPFTAMSFGCFVFDFCTGAA